MNASETDKARERRVRRAAKRKGVSLCKSSSRDMRSAYYGTYMLMSASRTLIVATAAGNGSYTERRHAPWPPYGMTLDDVEDKLKGMTPMVGSTQDLIIMLDELTTARKEELWAHARRLVDEQREVPWVDAARWKAD